MKEPKGQLKPRLDECYPVRLVSSLDDAAQLWGASGGARQGLQSERPAPSAPTMDGGSPQEGNGVPLLYDGDPITISHREGVWVPVTVAHHSLPVFPSRTKTCIVLPCVGPVEAIPGIWESDLTAEGEICIVGDDEFDVGFEKGMPVAEVLPASIRTQVCQKCGSIDTDALIDVVGS